ncbi:class I SAM-dependent methyltransferase [Microcella humidisoli]|uniref:Class I SAM-dependent methyltransferase n=1 Tax=Microcella humidisoli TaxID=2963406 RepID=A0ABY5FWZ0_9MICO|nr:class I SAM-dependent methyltransferase [Microcella humidisoli]UTT62832.1 class I SAM-dependent methyltransferase [Microcella humidisoli]
MSIGWVEREFDRRASTYDQSSFHVSLAEAAARFAAPTVKDAVLDVATGTGLVLRSLQTLPAAHLTGIDVSSAMLDVARSSLPGARFLQASASRLPFGPGEFDVITCVSAMPYLDDPVEAVREWQRVLVRDGRIVISVFTPDGLTGPTLLRRAARQHGLMVDDPNESTSTVDAWREIAAKVGMRVVRTESWTLALPSATVESLLKPQYPFGVRNDLRDATSDDLALVRVSLGELIATTDTWEASVLLLELREDG